MAGNSADLVDRTKIQSGPFVTLTRLPGNFRPLCRKGAFSSGSGRIPHARTKRRGGSRETMGAGISVVTLERREDGEVRARPLPAPAPSLRYPAPNNSTPKLVISRAFVAPPRGTARDPSLPSRFPIPRAFADTLVRSPAADPARGRDRLHHRPRAPGRLPRRHRRRRGVARVSARGVRGESRGGRGDRRRRRR